MDSALEHTSATTAPPRILPYRPPALGVNHWILDGALAEPKDVAFRCSIRPDVDWSIGAPRRAESWPGMRAPDALTAAELAPIEAWVRHVTGASRLWVEQSADGGALSHNHVQLVGANESGPRPHVDSMRLCTYAAVLYLHPFPLQHAGTSFYRQRLPDGTRGGNTCPPGARNLPEALGVRTLPLTAWEEELRVPNVFNRLLLYRADLVHSASAYFGVDHRSKRMTAVFFWKAE